MRAEAENNLVLSISKGASAYLATVETADGVVACAVRTPPHKLVLTRAEQPAAMERLAADALSVYPDLEVVLGPEPHIAAFAAAWAELAGRRIERGMRQRLHEIRRIESWRGAVKGRLRRAVASDLDAVIPWVAAFIEEAPAAKEDPAALARSRLKADSLFVWDDGGPVSMASWSGKTANGVRVNLVYTPHGLRGRGYATACVWALTEQLLAGGNKYCCLYTQLANPVSNRIYQRIGYRAVCDFTDIQWAK